MDRTPDTLEKENTFPNIINLNVGGSTYSTSLATLRMNHAGMLSSMFNGRYPVEMDDHGYVFIDRDGPTFRHILNFLRNNQFPSNSLSLAEKESIQIEAEFFGLDELYSWAERLIKEEKESEGQKIRDVMELKKTAEKIQHDIMMLEKRFGDVMVDPTEEFGCSSSLRFSRPGLRVFPNEES
mmetsp:Transcript_17976/g.23165  ORF Transcript_17976/g.23165 Transcript_17976/m.23165 type:complete len:182 (+) Transcript_17976:63-608(+)